MNDAITTARIAVADGRSQQQQQLNDEFDRQLSRQTYLVVHTEPMDGQRLGKLPNGGVVAIAPTSNGILTKDQLFMAVRDRGASGAHGVWMPR